MFFSVLCLLCLCARLFVCALWSPAWKGLTAWLSFVVSNCDFVTFTLVSWVRCGSWLYRFLIFPPYLLQPASTGFSWKILCNRNVRTYRKHTEAIANGEDIDIVYLDCCKAFDKVPHKKLLHTLYNYGITGQIFNWVKDFLSCKRQC